MGNFNSEWSETVRWRPRTSQAMTSKHEHGSTYFVNQTIGNKKECEIYQELEHRSNFTLTLKNFAKDRYTYIPEEQTISFIISI